MVKDPVPKCRSQIDEGSTASQSESTNGISTTVKISYQEGKLLGFYMVNSLSKNQLMASKRGNVISLSGKSVVFSFEEQLFKAAPRRLCYPSWGRKELPSLKLRNGSVSFDTINGESMKCVVKGKVRARDIVDEKIQYASQFGGATL